MKKILILMACVMLCAVSCSKDNGTSSQSSSSSKFLPGTTWADNNGNTVTFTSTTISINGTASSSYSITAEVDGIATYFSINNLKFGDITYVSGSAYVSQQLLNLTQGGGALKNDRFYKK